MVDFNKPLKLTRDHRENQTIRVIATDRVCPVGFNYVLLVRNPNAMFGDEEFVVTAKEDGTISGQGFSGKVVNISG